MPDKNPDHVTVEKPLAGRALLYAWAWRIALLLVFVGGFLTFAWHYDEPPPDDSDLLVTLPSLDKDDPDNGFSLMLEAGKLADAWPQDNPEFSYDILEAIDNNSDTMDIAKAKALLKLNEPAWAAFQRAFAKPKMFNPAPLDIKANWLSASISYARLARIQANVLFCEGKTSEALDLMEQVAENLIRTHDPEGKELAVTFLTNIATMGMIRENVLGNIHHLKTREQCQRAARILRKFEPLGSVAPFKMTLRIEHMYIRKMMENNGAKFFAEMRRLKDEGMIKNVPSRFSTKPTKLLRENAEMLRENFPLLSDETYFHLSPPSQKQSIIPEFIRKWPIWEKLGIGVISPAGELVVENNKVGLQRAWNLVIRAKQTTLLTQTALALRAYWLEHDHQLPPSLEALVPEYLPSLPIDLFEKNKAPLRYDAQRRLLWSVGVDGIDKGGDDSDNDLNDPLYNENEPTLKLPEWK